LVARGGDLEKQEFPLTGPLRIGRGPRNDIRLDTNEVSGKHARIVPARGGFRVEDLGSTNGTRVNGNLIRTHWLHHGDEIEIGLVRFLYLLPGKPVERHLDAFQNRRMAHERRFTLVAERGGKEWEIEPLPFTIGRGEDNDLPLEDESLSNQHARFLMEDHHLFLEDLGSTNGTYLRGRRIDKARVGHGAEVEIGRLFFLVRDVDYPFPRLEKPGLSRRWVTATVILLALLAGLVMAPQFFNEEPGEPRKQADPNLLKENASFDAIPGADGALPGWKLTGETFALDHEESVHGSTSLQVKLSTSAATWENAEALYRDTIPVEPRRTYRVACEVRVKYTNGVAGIRIDWFRQKESRPFAETYGDLVTGDTAWLTAEAWVTAPPEAAKARLALIAKGNGGTHWFDNIRIVPAEKGRSPSLKRFQIESLKVRFNRRGMLSLAADDRTMIQSAGLVFWNRQRIRKGEQAFCLPASGYPRLTADGFCLRAEAVKLEEGLTVPFEVMATQGTRGIDLRIRVHADRGHLVVGDRIAMAVTLGESVQQLRLTAKAMEERFTRTSFGSIVDVSEVGLIREKEDLVLRFDPPMTVNGRLTQEGEMTLYASVGVHKGDQGRILEVGMQAALPPDREEARAAEILRRAEEQVREKHLGVAYNLYGQVVKAYPGMQEAVNAARSRQASIEMELDRYLTNLEKNLIEFEAAPTANAFAAFLFRIEEMEALFGGMEKLKRSEALQAQAFKVYGQNAGPAFERARKVLAEAQAAYETGDWVRAETLCNKLLTELNEEALAPSARAVLSEIRRRRADQEEIDAWVEGRLRAARELETRDDKETAKAVYREILRRYPRGEWARFAEEQIRRLDR
jgi:pSer/pThr/pTyr-binding forkhead associated (FHA) protein